MTQNPNALTAWAHNPKAGRHFPGFSIACENDDGSIYWGDLERGASFAIAIKAAEIGACDMVLCGGIQHLEDAQEIVRALWARAKP
jgi:hypothetical protein